VSYLGIVFAALSDVVPCALRAQSYGLLLAGFYGGYSLAPTMALVSSGDDLVTAVMSLTLIVASLLLALLWLPETLPRSAAAQSHENLVPEQSNISSDEALSALSRVTQIVAGLGRAMLRPFQEISILNRSRALRLLTVASFFAAMVFAADTTLVIYYVEETLNVQKSDIASMTLAMGVAGILFQGGLLQQCIGCIGEHSALLLSFLCGTLHNFLYGAARSKPTIYVALVVSQLTKTNFPLLSSLASKDVSVHEQGRVQTALFATNAIANAIGPLALEFVYHFTKHWKGRLGGPGFMFIFAAGLYAIGAVVVSLIPVKHSTVDHVEEVDTEFGAATDGNVDGIRDGFSGPTDLMTEPLLSNTDSFVQNG
jgi:Na+/melibiose symporter-like transporter